MSTLLRNVRVIDSLGNCHDAHGVMVARDRIERVAPCAAFEGFTGEVHDLTDCSVLSGLIDGHVHLVHGADRMRLAGEGRISEGAFADLLVVDGNPPADIARVADRRHHRMVRKRGAVHGGVRETLQTVAAGAAAG